MQPRDKQYLEDIVTHGEEAIRYLHATSAEEYAADRRLQLITERLLSIIGEAASRLSEEARAEIRYEWRGVVGLRNVLMHQYRAVVQERVYMAAAERLPALVAAVRPYAKPPKENKGKRNRKST